MTHMVSVCNWNYNGGVQGYTKFRWGGAQTASEANQALEKLRVFFAALSTYLPAGVNVSFQALHAIYDVTGQLQGGVNATTVPAAVNGSGTGVWSAVTGAWINWKAAGVVNGRQVEGRTFLVPLSNTTVFQTDGSLSAAFIAAAQAAATALITGPPSMIINIHRGPTNSHPNNPVVDGEHTVISAQIPDKAGVLRSRR